MASERVEPVLGREFGPAESCAKCMADSLWIVRTDYRDGTFTEEMLCAVCDIRTKSFDLYVRSSIEIAETTEKGRKVNFDLVLGEWPSEIQRLLEDKSSLTQAEIDSFPESEHQRITEYANELLKAWASELEVAERAQQEVYKVMASQRQENSTLLRSPCGHNNKSTSRFCIYCGFKIR